MLFIFNTVDDFRSNNTLVPHAIALEISSWIDDWHEVERTLTTFDRLVTLSKKGETHPDIDEKILLSIVRNGKTINNLVSGAPMPSYTALKAVEKSISNGNLILHPPDFKPLSGNTAANPNELFYEYKSTYKKIISSKDPIEKIKGLIGFCKDHFDLTFVIATTNDTLIRCVVFFKDHHGELKSKETKNIPYDINKDPVFSRAYNSGFSFFGNLFPTNLVKDLVEIPTSGECAVIPLGKKGDRVNLIYTVSGSSIPGIGPFNYLELLSWLINPEIENPVDFKTADQAGKDNISSSRKKQDSDQPVLKGKSESLTDIINDLPPMPHLASQMLQILSDPDSSVEDLTTILVQDQAMMATLIKVSNSALYRTGQEIRTLNDAVTRLGFKTI